MQLAAVGGVCAEKEVIVGVIRQSVVEGASVEEKMIVSLV